MAAKKTTATKAAATKAAAAVAPTSTAPAAAEKKESVVVTDTSNATGALTEEPGNAPATAVPVVTAEEIATGVTADTGISTTPVIDAAAAAIVTAVSAEKPTTAATASLSQEPGAVKEVDALFIKSRSTKGFRRIGRRFTPEGYGIALDVLTADEIEILQSDKNLIVEECTVEVEQ